MKRSTQEPITTEKNIDKNLSLVLESIRETSVTKFVDTG